MEFPETAAYVRSFGIEPKWIDDVDAWIQQQVESGKKVGEWQEGFIIYGEGNAPIEIPEIRTVYEGLEYFSEGDLDCLACNNWVISLPDKSDEFIKVFHDLMKVKESDDQDSEIEIPDIAEFTAGNAYLTNLWGKIQALNGQIARAGESFRKACELMPEYGEPYGNLGTLMWKVNQRRDAFLLFIEALLKCPQSSSAQLNFFDAGYELEEHAAIAKIVEEAMKLAPDCLEFQHHLAICYHREGRKADAIGVLEGILLEHPNDVEARDLFDGYQKDPVQS